VACDRGGFEKTEYMGKGNIKNQEMREVHIDLDIAAYIKKKRLVWMDM